MKTAAVLLSLLFFTSSLFAQSDKKAGAQEKSKASAEQVSPLRRADMISVKASLEEMLVRRYTQELSSMVEYDQFHIGASFDLESTEGQGRIKDGTLYNDLELSHLNADELFESYSIPNMGLNPLEKYAIKGVQVNVGLKEELGEEAKTAVNEWLTAKVQKDFGKFGEAQVQFIKNPGNGFMMKWLKELQGLVGSIILALAILLGVVLWRMMSSNNEAAATGESSSTVNIQSEAQISGAGAGAEESSKAAELNDKIEHLTAQIKEFSVKVSGEVDELIKEWCDKGEEGLYRLASFAEISSTVLGTLPIPAEHKKKMGEIFSGMHKLDAERRHEVLNKTYWDLVASLNLGVETIREPFSFINNANTETVNKVLLGNDVQTQTVVTMYMPESMRKAYVEDLDQDKKLELLNSAAKLSSISEDNLKNIESQYAPYFEEKLDESEVSMTLTLSKLINALSMVDACLTLPKVEGPVANKFKRSNPHIAFLPEWDETPLSYLAKRCANEELLAYLRVMPDMTHTIMEFVSPRTQNMLEDDLEQEDSLTAEQKEKYLSSLNNRIKTLVDQGEIEFHKVFAKKGKDNNEDNIKLAA